MGVCVNVWVCMFVGMWTRIATCTSIREMPIKCFLLRLTVHLINDEVLWHVFSLLVSVCTVESHCVQLLYFHAYWGHHIFIAKRRLQSRKKIEKVDSINALLGYSLVSITSFLGCCQKLWVFLLHIVLELSPYNLSYFS